MISFNARAAAGFRSCLTAVPVPARALLPALLTLVLIACSGGPSATPAATPTPSPSATVLSGSPLGPNLTPIIFRSASGAEATLRVRVEATGPAREQGLMNITKLPDDEGDLFVFQDVSPNQDVVAPFWMKDTKIPLSIAFVAADGHILEEQDMAAESEALHPPHQPYRYAIEANQGWYDQHGMPQGATVDLSSVFSRPR